MKPSLQASLRVPFSYFSPRLPEYGPWSRSVPQFCPGSATILVSEGQVHFRGATQSKWLYFKNLKSACGPWLSASLYKRLSATGQPYVTGLITIGKRAELYNPRSSVCVCGGGGGQTCPQLDHVAQGPALTTSSVVKFVTEC